MFKISMTKICKDCEKELSVHAFPEAPGNQDGYATRCRGCARLIREENKEELNRQNREWKQSKRGKVLCRDARRRYHLKHLYGLSVKQHEQMYVDQEGRCMICCETVLYDEIHTDHDHKTGEVRGLLCQRCNHMLGGARDNPSILRAAVEYLEGDK